ncbi:hypothetical protein P5673_001093 [Acropora cervicornis]|uniref:Uncharacterized protein n=1 Tax=Acropora cervicornis TaxID=6130 RepID=A0AAD9R614_ACRCE|nr:hypothetical protein P5673_001093 [Acropora cervicornis]
MTTVTDTLSFNDADFDLIKKKSLKERDISSLVVTLQRDVADYSQVILDA